VTRRIYFKDYLAPGCREPFSLRQGRLDDLTTTRFGDGAHPNPKSPAKGSARHPRGRAGREAATRSKVVEEALLGLRMRLAAWIKYPTSAAL
jgi:hypothetical protein